RGDRLQADLARVRGGRLGRAGVHPHAGECAAGRVPHVCRVVGAALRALGDPLAVLRGDAGPQLVRGTDALEQLLQPRGHAVAVPGQVHVALRVGGRRTPLRAPEHQVHLGTAGGDADAVLAAAVRQVLRAGERVRGPERADL